MITLPTWGYTLLISFIFLIFVVGFWKIRITSVSRGGRNTSGGPFFWLFIGFIVVLLVIAFVVIPRLTIGKLNSTSEDTESQ